MSEIDKVYVIDVGSGSLWIVVYDASVQPPRVRFEKKHVCALARDMDRSDPKLDPAGMKAALEALRQYREMIEKDGDPLVFVVGTAALRAVEHTPAGKVFHAAACEALGRDIPIISEIEEARLTGVGVLVGIPNADGLFINMGGGSIEIGEIKQGVLTSNLVTFPIGHLTLATESQGNPLAAARIFRGYMDDVTWLANGEGKSLYLTGGTYRTLSRVMLDGTHDIPVKSRFPHGMMVPWYSAVNQITKLSETRPQDIIDTYHKKKDYHQRIRDRAYAIPSAAAILLAFAAVAKPGFIVSSHYGMREGAWADGLARLRL